MGFFIQLQPIGGSPIPKGSRGSYRFTVTGNKDFTFAEIDFSKPGKYIYALKALEQKNGPKVNLDSSINKVEIDVYNQGDSFKEIFIYRNEKGEKLESLIYKHTIKEDHNSQENKPQKPDKEKPDKTPKMGDIKMVYYFVALLLALIMLVNIRRKRKYGGKI